MHVNRILKSITAILTILCLFQSPVLAEDKKPTLAVWDLELGEGVHSTTRAPLSDTLRTQLWQTNNYTVVDRSSMGRILEEQEFQQTECFSNECIVEVGQLLGVQKMVSGRLGLLGNKYILNIQLIDIESGRIEKISRSECVCQIEQLTTLISEATTKLAGRTSKQPQLRQEPGVEEAVETGNLSIATIPPGAEVYIDAIARGTTPLVVENISVGIHSLAMTKEDYNPFSETIEVRPNQTGEINRHLSIQSGNIQVNTEPFGAKIYLDDRYVGNSPYKIVGVPIGQHKIELRHSEDYYDSLISVDVSFGELLTVNETLKGKPCTALVLSSPEEADVIIDGKFAGKTPYNGAVESVPHRVIVSKDGYVSHEKEYDFDPNSSKTITVSLKKSKNPLQDGQIWRGQYVCSQGETNLDLEIVKVDGLKIRAIFRFHHTRSGSKGSYWLNGTYDPISRKLILKTDSWIKRPGGYGMVGMDGHVSSDLNSYSGKITSARCGRFSVKRVSQ